MILFNIKCEVKYEISCKVKEENPVILDKVVGRSSWFKARLAKDLFFLNKTNNISILIIREAIQNQ